MISEDLIKYIKNQKKKGAKIDEIKSALVDKGWKEVDVEETLGYIEMTAPHKANLTMIIITFIIIVVVFIRYFFF